MPKMTHKWEKRIKVATFLSALAIANGMCRGPTGNVNHDTGLQTALHIAHETGHKWVVNLTVGVAWFLSPNRIGKC